ncbi:hypothetical protein [Spiroplasma endosymbiont of Agriotes lineatus]|uniref:hypothetical protein n=1 Tax=Spiroplasma endosymbiont of Agriotes lineatus TaxID=3077930 RepID=UPI0030CC1CC9
MFEKCKMQQKPNRDVKYLLKAYERDIPAQRVEIVKLKSELESLKTKEMQTKQEKQPDLFLENENLRLKKEILEMELKLNETNRKK